MCFFRPIGKTRWPPWPLIGWYIFNFSSETAEWNSTKFDRKQDLNVLYQVCVFFGPIGKKRWPPWPLIGWDIFDFSSETAERNSTKLDSKQDFNVLYQVCVFRADRKNKMAVLAFDWLRHFRLLLWNRWMEFNETWQEARSQFPLQSLYFSGRSVNKNVRLGRFLKEVAHCTQVHDMWPFGPLVCFPIGLKTQRCERRLVLASFQVSSNSVQMRNQKYISQSEVMVAIFVKNMVKTLAEGGCNMTHVNTFFKSLKLTWIRRIIN